MQGLQREMSGHGSWVRQLAGALLDIVFPPRCHCCRSFIPDAGPLHICTSCLEQMSPAGSPLCTVCGVPFLTEGGIDHPCSSCRAHPPPFSAARAPFLYDGPLRKMIHHFKYERRVALRRPLALLVAGGAGAFREEARADVVVPVPLHVKRLRQRGFNQAILIGEMIARQWGLPLCRTNLRRIRWTEPQIDLPAAERLRNVRGAFAVSDPSRIQGKRVLLVDDVYTTGATVMECSRTLLGAGAADVFVLTVARAIHY